MQISNIEFSTITSLQDRVAELELRVKTDQGRPLYNH